MLIVACVSSHGFGHGARVAAVLRALHQLEPRCRFVLSSALPEAFVARSFAGIPLVQRHCQWDVGVIQADALGSDPEATLAALAGLEQRLPQQLDQESAWLTQQRRAGEPALVLADVPPAAALLAQRLAIPLVWHGNFGWDSIYAELGERFNPWAEQSLQRYRLGQALIRCPFALPMPWQLPECAIGLSAAAPHWPLNALQERLNWRTPRDRSALLCFGGLGLRVEPWWLEQWPDWRFLVLDPALAVAANAQLVLEPLRPLDVMPLCSVVITKPGYSTFCEALSQNCGLIVVQREGFAEAAVLEQQLQRHGHHRLLSRGQFAAGHWDLDQPLQPPSAQPLECGGAAQAAQFLLQQLLQSA